MQGGGFSTNLSLVRWGAKISVTHIQEIVIKNYLWRLKIYFFYEEEKMGKNIKRLSLALVALGLSAPVLADTCSPFDVTVPNQQGGFTFGADALLMRGTSPDLGYITTFGPATTAGAFTSSSGTISDVDTTYQWGFDAMVGYRIPGTGNDLTLSWTHLGNFDDSDSTSVPFSGVVDETAVTGSTNASGDVEYDYDAVDLDLGQRVNFGDYFQFRMFAGARWADVKQDLDTSSGVTINTPAVASGTVAAFTDNDSEFKGIGPQIGFDGRFCLGYGFGIDANLTASLLVGDVDDDANISTIVITGADGVTSGTSTSVDDDSRDRVVPALDASLGLDYTYAFANCDRSFLTVQAGYKVINYFDATQNAVDVGALGGGTFTLGNATTNVAFDGPYAGIKVNL